jgi:response regulator RpfG family c-di-GMP phosphodiesterase
MDFQIHDEAPRVLVVDDEKVIREILSDFLTMEGYQVQTVEDGSLALRELSRRHYNLVISDLKMPRMGGLELLEKIAEMHQNVLTVIMTGFGTVETAIEAMKRGAYDYILKPFKVEEVVHIVQRGLEKQRLTQENIRLKEALSLYKVSELISTSLSLERILELVIDTALIEVKADAVTLHLEDMRSGQYQERLRRRAPDLDHDDLGVLNLGEILTTFREERPLIAHGQRAHRYFLTPPNERRLVSQMALPLRGRERINGILSLYSYTRGNKFTEGQRKMLAIVAARAAAAIENAQLYENLLLANRDLETANFALEVRFRQTIQGLCHALEASDRYTRGHSDRVGAYSRLIAVGLGLSDPEIEKVYQSALMHDIGKIGIRNDRLNKPGALTREEIEMFRSHPAKGKHIIEPIEFLHDLIPGVYCHHEQFNGSGYPQGLIGESIPLLGRIVAVADTYDAMTSDRAYRKALPKEVAVAELRRFKGTQFDPICVDAFLKELPHSELESPQVVAASSAPPAPAAAPNGGSKGH